MNCPYEFYDRNVTASKLCTSFESTEVPFYSAGAAQDENVGSAFLRDGYYTLLAGGAQARRPLRHTTTDTRREMPSPASEHGCSISVVHLIWSAWELDVYH